MRHGQAEHLVPLIESTLAAAGITFADLDAVGVTTGPGGFTGVRIGLATARGYGLGLAIPVVGTTRFAVFAAAAADAIGGEPDRPLLVAVDTRRSEPALQWCDATARPLGDPWTATPETAARTPGAAAIAVAGDAADPVATAFRAAGRDARIVPGTAATDPDALGRVLADAADHGDGRLPRPLYLRGADVTPDPSAHTPTEPR